MDMSQEKVLTEDGYSFLLPMMEHIGVRHYIPYQPELVFLDRPGVTGLVTAVTSPAGNPVIPRFITDIQNAKLIEGTGPIPPFGKYRFSQIGRRIIHTVSRQEHTGRWFVEWSAEWHGQSDDVAFNCLTSIFPWRECVINITYRVAQPGVMNWPEYLAMANEWMDKFEVLNR